jgi:hypothetical protein
MKIMSCSNTINENWVDISSHRQKCTNIAVEAFYEESKNMWKWNRLLTITILYYPQCHCLEVIVSDDSNENEPEHIFIDYIKLSHKFSNEQITDHEVYSAIRTNQLSQSHLSPYDIKTITRHKLMAKHITDRIHLVEIIDPSTIRGTGKSLRVTLCPIAGDDTKIVGGVEMLDIICPKPKLLQSFGDLLSDADKQLQRQLQKAHLTEVAEIAFRSSQERLRDEEEVSDLSDQEDESLKKWEVKRVARRILDASASDDVPFPTQHGEATLYPTSPLPSFDLSTTTSHSHSLLPDIEGVHSMGSGSQSKKKTPRRSFDQSSSVTTLGSSSRCSAIGDGEMSVAFFASGGFLHGCLKSQSSSSSSSAPHSHNKLPSLRVASFNNRNAVKSQKSSKIDSLVEGIAATKMIEIPPEDVDVLHSSSDFALHD